jgi:hypothetical protein
MSRVGWEGLRLCHCEEAAAAADEAIPNCVSTPAPGLGIAPSTKGASCSETCRRVTASVFCEAVPKCDLGIASLRSQ